MTEANLGDIYLRKGDIYQSRRDTTKFIQRLQGKQDESKNNQ